MYDLETLMEIHTGNKERREHAIKAAEYTRKKLIGYCVEKNLSKTNPKLYAKIIFIL